MPSNQSQTFSASYDTTTKIISTVVCLVFLGIAIGVRDTRTDIVIGALSVITFGLSYGYSPRGYIVADRAVTVRRLIGNARIALEDLRELREAHADDFSGCIRLWGNGGFFGYYGLFRTSKLGKCTWYLTNRDRAVVCITGAKTVLFSPDDVEGFLEAIRATVPVSGVVPVREAAGLRRPVGSVGVWIGLAVVVIVTVVLGFALLYSPGPPRLTLTGDALTIHDRFYPVTVKAADVDTAHIRVVDIASEQDWRPTLRTNGFANAHYRAGWFRVGNGQQVRLFRSDSRRLVLLPPKGAGAAVLLEVPEPDRFVDEVRRDWGSR